MSRTIPHVAYKYIKHTHVYVGTYIWSKKRVRRSRRNRGALKKEDDIIEEWTVLRDRGLFRPLGFVVRRSRDDAFFQFCNVPWTSPVTFRLDEAPLGRSRRVSGSGNDVATAQTLLDRSTSLETSCQTNLEPLFNTVEHYSVWRSSYP